MNERDIALRIVHAQLEQMDEDDQIIDVEKDEWEPEVKAVADFLEIPFELEPAFRAYYHEFLVNHREATHIGGAFFNDEDTCYGIKDKFLAFVWPIVGLVRQDLGFDERIYVTWYCDPCYEDVTTFLVVAESFMFRDVRPVIIYRYERKPWAIWWNLESKEEQDGMFYELSNIYLEIRKNLQEFTDTLPKE